MVSRTEDFSFEKDIVIGKHIPSIIPKDINTEFCKVFQNVRLIEDPISLEDQAKYESTKKRIQLVVGDTDRPSHIESKFSGASLPYGPFYNSTKNLIYHGSVKNGSPHGWGEAVTIDGDYYIGYFDEGTMNYYGKCVCRDGTMYEGGLYRTSRDGYGKLTLPKGAVQEGEWKFNTLYFSNTPTARQTKSLKKSNFESLTTEGSTGNFTNLKLISEPPEGDNSPPLESSRRPITIENSLFPKSPDMLDRLDDHRLKSCLKKSAAKGPVLAKKASFSLSNPQTS